MRSVDEERELDGWTDEALLALASDEGRALVTFDAKDFPDIARRWAETGRAHAGLAIVVGIDHGEFGEAIRCIERVLAQRPEIGDWADYTCFVSRGGE